MLIDQDVRNRGKYRRKIDLTHGNRNGLLVENLRAVGLIGTNHYIVRIRALGFVRNPVEMARYGIENRTNWSVYERIPHLYRSMTRYRLDHEGQRGTLVHRLRSDEIGEPDGRCTQRNGERKLDFAEIRLGSEVHRRIRNLEVIQAKDVHSVHPMCPDSTIRSNLVRRCDHRRIEIRAFRDEPGMLVESFRTMDEYVKAIDPTGTDPVRIRVFDIESERTLSGLLRNHERGQFRFRLAGVGDRHNSFGDQSAERSSDRGLTGGFRKNSTIRIDRRDTRVQGTPDDHAGNVTIRTIVQNSRRDRPEFLADRKTCDGGLDRNRLISQSLPITCGNLGSTQCSVTDPEIVDQPIESIIVGNTRADAEV